MNPFLAKLDELFKKSCPRLMRVFYSIEFECFKKYKEFLQLYKKD